MSISWKILYTTSVVKQLNKLNENVLYLLRILTKELSINGPVASQWPNYSKLHGDKQHKYHCHLKKGRPTYVCCWRVVSKEHKVIEVYYVGTHEKAPY